MRKRVKKEFDAMGMYGISLICFYIGCTTDFSSILGNFVLGMIAGYFLMLAAIKTVEIIL